MNSKKITFFLTMFYGGGGERVVFDLAEGFVERGYAVDIVVVKKEGKLLNAVPEGVHIVELASPRLLSSISALRRYLKKEEPAAILSISEHAHLVMLVAAFFARVKTKTVVRIGIPFSVLFAGYRSWKDKLIPLAGRVLYPRADVIITNSKGAADDFSRTIGIPRDRIEVIYNPKNLEHIEALAKEPAPHPWLAEREQPVIVAIGRLAWQKGFDVLIGALAHMREDARLIIIGDGGERERLRELAKDLKVFERVALVGFQENPYAYLARADVFALSSRWEGFPNALIEALALGVPSVAADCPYGPRELLAPESDHSQRTTGKGEEAAYGMLVPVSESEELARALDRLLADTALSARYAALGKRRAQEFALPAIVEHYEQVLFS